MRREQLKEQYLNIRCCTINDYLENRVEGNDIENGRYMFGRIDNICKQCYALKWKPETKGFCCQNRQVILKQLNPVPQPLLDLLTSENASFFLRHIRLYNSILAFTSLQAEIDKELASAERGVYTFQLHGTLYHQIGGLQPRDEGLSPTFAQIYFMIQILTINFKSEQTCFQI